MKSLFLPANLSNDLAYVRGRLALNQRTLTDGAKNAFKIFDQPRYQFSYVEKVKDNTAVEGI